MIPVILRYCILFASICLFSFSVHAQNWRVEQYTEENGLPSNYLYCISYEKEKILMGTNAGLVLFDGHSFEIEEHFKNTYPIYLSRWSDSLLYISTYRNGFFKKTKNGLKRSRTSKGNLAIIDYETNFVLYDVFENYVDNSIASNRKLHNELMKYPAGYGLAGSREGVYYFSQQVLELIDWEGNKKGAWNLEDSITTVFSQGEYLFAGHKGGKFVRWKEGTESQPFQLDTDFDIQKIYSYNDSSLIVVNSKDEYDQLYFVQFDSGFTKIIKREKILNKHVEINDVFVKDGVVFCATYGEGLYVLSPTVFLTFDTHNQGLPALKKLVQDEQGTIWGNSLQNVYKVDIEEGISKLAFSSKLTSIIQTSKKKTYISVGTVGGYLSDMNLNIVTPKSSIKEVFYSNDSILFGYGNYYFLEMNINQKTEDVLFSILKSKTVYGKFNSGVYLDSVVCLGTDIGLIKLIKTEDEKWVEAEQNDAQHFFDEKKITQIVHHKGGLFIIAGGSLFFYRDNKVEECVFSSLEDVQVNKIMFDSKSNLFIGTDKGFWYLNPNKTLHYDESNGLLSEKVYNFLEDRDSNVWIATGKSLEVIKYKDLCAVPAPQLFFKKTVERPDGVSLTISSCQYDFPNDLKLAYKLNNGKWIPLNTNFLDLRNLAPENYTCYVRGKRNNSGWSPALTYSFEVHAEWYQTTIFRFLTFFVLLILSFLFFRMRLKKQKAKNRILENEISQRKKLEKKVKNLREEISQDFHDELGNKIASISGISNTMVASVTGKNIPKIKAISRLSSEIYDSTKDFVWLLDPANNNLKSLCFYLRDYGENYFDLMGNIDFFFYQKNIKEIPVSYEWMKNIVLTFKEITTNIIKHSSATEVTMDVKLQETVFSIQIYDNGEGFVYEDVKHGNGLRNIVSRMQKLNAEISTDYNNGVSYCFKLKTDEVWMLL